MTSRCTLALALLFGGCDFYYDPDPSTYLGGGGGSPTGDDVADPQCDPTIVVPGVQAAPDPDRTPDDHEEVYGDDPTPYQVRIGWPGSDTSRSISFLWRTDLDTLASVVEWGPNGELTNRSEGKSFTFGGSNADQARIHELKLCGELEPGTTYSYRVGGDGHWSDTFTFTTPPEPGSFDTFTVAITGDSRGAYAEWALMLDAIDSYDPDLILFSGDMVEFGTDQTEWNEWFAAGEGVLESTVLVPAHGNHEFLAINYFAQFSLPNNESWFSIDYGTMTVASLNDSFVPIDVLEYDEVAFLDEVFGQSEADWKFVMHHRPMYSTCTRHGSETTLRQFWEPPFERHNVDFVLAGHNHIYERSQPIRNGDVAEPGEGTMYLVTGGAGAPLYPNYGSEWFSDVATPEKHFAIAEFDPDGVQYTVRDLAGVVLDEFYVPLVEE